MSLDKSPSDSESCEAVYARIAGKKCAFLLIDVQVRALAVCDVFPPEWGLY